MTYQKVTGTLSQGAHPGSYNGQDAWNDMFVVDLMKAYNSHPQDSRITEAKNIAETISVKYAKGSADGMLIQEQENDMAEKYIVRRLTEVECERLQGYPDNWTNPWPDGMWTDTNGKRHKVAASHRYKALGNSIAIPCWMFILNGVSHELKASGVETPTMGSLFDGIGGFPGIWEHFNGKGSAVWASEIEEFPIAVTKYWFPEDGE